MVISSFVIENRFHLAGFKNFLLALWALADHLQMMGFDGKPRARLELAQCAVQSTVWKLFDMAAGAADQLVMMPFL